MLACWVEDPDGDYFKKHLARIPDYLWVAEDGMKMQVRRLAFCNQAVESRDLRGFRVLNKKWNLCAEFWKSAMGYWFRHAGLAY